MSCMCSKQLTAIASGLKNLPIAALSAMLNDKLGPLNVVANLAPRVCASVSALATAHATANASASASAAANASISAAAMARLEALASVNRSMGAGALTPTVAARLNVLIASTNQQLPDVLSALNEFLEPISAAIDKLLAAMASLQGIQAMTGKNLAMPGVSFNLPSAQASASASASAQASATAAVSASATASANARASLSANAMLAMRLNAVAIGLGFPLPAKAPSLDAAIRLTAGLPPVKLPTSLLNSIHSKLAALASTSQMLGMSLVTPNAGLQLKNALAIAQANLTASISGTATASASLVASTAVSAAATAAASLNANAVMSAAANLNLSAIPNLQPLATSLSLSASLSGITGAPMLSAKPCSSCSFKF